MLNFRKAKLARLAANTSQFPGDGKAQIVFAGKSNVGKSSLINLLTGQRSLARVGGAPGKTRQILFFDVDDSFYLVDVPGYGYARAGKSEKAEFSRLTDAYFTSDEPIALVFLLLDCRHKPSAEDLAMLDWLAESRFPYSVILTKADKLKQAEIRRQVNALQDHISQHQDIDCRVLVSSASKRRGIGEIRGLIAGFLGLDLLPVD